MPSCEACRGTGENIQECGKPEPCRQCDGTGENEIKLALELALQPQPNLTTEKD